MHTAAVTIQSALIGSWRLRAIPATAIAPTSANSAAESFLIMISACPSSPQAPQRPRVTRHDGVAVAMPPAVQYFHPGTPHAVDGAAAGCEYPAVQQLIVAPLQERRMSGGKCHQVQGGAGGKSTGGVGAIRGVQPLPAALHCGV